MKWLVLGNLRSKKKGNVREMLMAAMIPLEKVVLGKEKDDELSCRKVRLESLSYIPIWESVQRFEASHQRKIVK